MDVPFQKDISKKYSINSLSTKQRKIFHTFMNSLNNGINYKNSKCYFIDGPGGSGKSDLLNSIITYLYQEKVSVLPVAWTEIAANLLINGRTSHVTFKLPLNINDESTCNISPNSEYEIKLRKVKVIIWDEITMTSKHEFEAVNKLFRDICENNKIFGGKLILVLGDFRQTLPIVKRGNRTKIVENCVI